MSFQLSVITCSHNPRPDYLKRVVGALRNQTLDQSQWEYLLIDNASTDPLAPKVNLSWHSNAKHIREEQLGLTHARLRGIREAAGDLLVFVDDDNLLDPDFLEQALKIADEWPQLGSWSGQTRPGFEEQPPEWTKRYWGNLVIRSPDRDMWSNLPHLPETMPCGAGLCVRRHVAQHYLMLHESGKRAFLLDRVGDLLRAAGDNDLAACACDVGLGIGVFLRLRLTHLIPAARLEESYLLRLIENIAYSGVVFRAFRTPPENTRRLVTDIADVARQLLLNARERRVFRAYKRGERRAHKMLRQREAAEASSQKIGGSVAESRS